MDLCNLLLSFAGKAAKFVSMFTDEGSKKFLVALVSPVILALAINCAKNLPPPGGPEDKTPPEVTDTYPQPNSINIPVDIEIEVTFSESINRKSIPEGVFISPIFEEEPEYNWSGKTLKIKPEGNLLEDRTYVVVVGTDVSDLRGNRLESSFSFAFSTGDSIDIGVISGNAYIGDDISRGLGVWAYILNDTLPPDPVNDVPDYMTQVGENGEYSLSFLAPAEYRLFAVNDRNKDKLWDSDSEEYGTAPKDYSINSEMNFYENINLTATKADTLPPLISSCNMLEGKLLRIRFESGVDRGSALDISNYDFRSETGGESPFIPTSIYMIPADDQNVFIRGEFARESAACSLSIFNLRSQDGVVIDTTDNSCAFITSDKPDTTGPQVIRSYPASRTTHFPPDSVLQVVFSEPVLADSVIEGFSLEDTLGNQISGEFGWRDTLALFYKPESLAGDYSYRLKLDPAKVMDIFYNAMEDTVWEVDFGTMPADTGGTVEGVVESAEPSRVGVNFISIPGGKERRYFLSQPGDFEFPDVPGAKYILYAFLDYDEDGDYYTGGYKPFRFSEPRVFYPDTISVRPRWITDGIKIEFK